MDAKAFVFEMKKVLAEKLQEPVKVSHCYELLSAAFGFHSFHHLQAAVREQTLKGISSFERAAVNIVSRATVLEIPQPWAVADAIVAMLKETDALMFEVKNPKHPISRSYIGLRS